MEMLNRNSHGVTMERKDYTKRSVVDVRSCNGKYLLRKYRFNNVPFFEHKYLSWANLDNCGGWSCDNNELDLIRQGRKLVAEKHYIIDADESIDDVLKYIALPRTFTVNVVSVWDWGNGRKNYGVVFASRASLAECFDFNEVIEAYKAHGIVLSPSETIQLSKAFTPPISAYIKAGYKITDPITDVDLIITGLMLGYPIESTASIIMGY